MGKPCKGQELQPSGLTALPPCLSQPAAVSAWAGEATATGKVCALAAVTVWVAEAEAGGSLRWEFRVSEEDPAGVAQSHPRSHTASWARAESHCLRILSA